VRVEILVDVAVFRGVMQCSSLASCQYLYEGWNFNSGNYLFTTDTK